MYVQVPQHMVAITFSLVFTILAVACFGTLLYILPYILFDMQYEVPHFVVLLDIYYEQNQDIGGVGYILLSLLPIVIAGILFILLAKWAADQADEVKRIIMEERKAAYTVQHFGKPVGDHPEDILPAAEGEVGTEETEAEEALTETRRHIVPEELSKKSATILGLKLAIALIAIVVVIFLVESVIIYDTLTIRR